MSDGSYSNPAATLTDPAASPDAQALQGRVKAGSPNLSLRMSEDNVRLLADFDPAGAKARLDSDAARRMLVAHGLSALFIDEAALAQLVRRCAAATAAFTLQIGERRDAECAIRISDDSMTAWMTLTRPQGGKPMTRETVNRALGEKGIIHGVLEDELEAALAEEVVDDRVIARGTEPTQGVDAKFESLVPEIKDRRPHVDEHDIADYRDLEGFVTIKQGDALMRRTPAAPGEDGMDIRGGTVVGKTGKDIPFAPGLKGTATHPEDGNLLVSTIAGQPVLVRPNGVFVDPTITVPQVNVATGNVKFEGALHVKGDVKSGMKIQVSSDVIVDGVVESAEIDAGGDVVVKGGVIGSGESCASGDAPRARICCKGTLRARFLENVQVRAGIDIVIDEFSMHSELFAQNQVVVGKHGTQKGHIRGGRVSASNLVKAAVIGTPNGITTRVQVGLDASIQERLASGRHQLDICESEQDKLEKLIAFLCQHHATKRDGTLEKARHTLSNLYAEMARLVDEQRELKEAQQLVDQARVLAQHKVYAGTEIHIGGKLRRPNDEEGPCVFRLHDGEIVCGDQRHIFSLSGSDPVTDLGSDPGK